MKTGICAYCLNVLPVGGLPCPCAPRDTVIEKAITAGRGNPPDMVNHPPHYRAHPSGVECIQITEHMGFCLGNAVKYIWRADLKNDAVEDLKKAAWYLAREIERRSETTEPGGPQ